MDTSEIPSAVIEFQKKYPKLSLSYAVFKNERLIKKYEPIDQINQYYDLASLTKVLFSSVLVNHYLKRKELSLEQTVNYYIGKKCPEGLKKVCIQDLLTHRSGLPPWLPLYLKFKTFSDVQAAAVIEPVAGQKGKRVYSDLGIMTLGEVIRTLDSNPWLTWENQLNPASNDLKFGPIKSSQAFPTSLGNSFEKKMALEYLQSLSITDEDWQNFNWRKYQIQGEVNDGHCHYLYQGKAFHAGLFGRLSAFESIIRNISESPPINTDLYVKDSSLLGLDGNIAEGWIGHHGFTGCSFLYHPEKKDSIVLLSNRQVEGLLSQGEYLNWKGLLPILFNHYF